MSENLSTVDPRSATEEIWKNIPGYEGLYQVSNLGRVKSVERKAKIGNGKLRKVRERILSPGRVKENGHLIVNLSKHGKTKMNLVHRLVLEAFDGAASEGMVCCHWDGVKDNNKLSNLRWDTIKGNSGDDLRNGVREKIRGENHGNNKNSKEDVIEIRRLYDTGLYTTLQLANIFGKSYHWTYCIVKRLKWTYLE